MVIENGNCNLKFVNVWKEDLICLLSNCDYTIYSNGHYWLCMPINNYNCNDYNLLSCNDYNCSCNYNNTGDAWLPHTHSCIVSYTF